MEKMHENRNFEREASRRKRTALWLALAIHAAIIVAFVLSANSEKLLPDFVQELFSTSEKQKPKPLYP